MLWKCGKQMMKHKKIY